jgi:hypothetical protein
METFGTVVSSSAWIAAVGAVAAIAMTATVILLHDYLRLESRALTLQAENELLQRQLRSLAGQMDEQAGAGARDGISDRRLKGSALRRPSSALRLFGRPLHDAHPTP